jgi:hypothetical protein
VTAAEAKRLADRRNRENAARRTRKNAEHASRMRWIADATERARAAARRSSAPRARRRQQRASRPKPAARPRPAPPRAAASPSAPAKRTFYDIATEAYTDLASREGLISESGGLKVWVTRGGAA